MTMNRNWPLLLAAWVTVCAGLAGRAEAGQLVLVNTSNQAITCRVDGWTADNGVVAQLPFTVPANRTFYVGQNRNRPTAVIDWAQCGDLPPTRMMNITPAGPDGRLVLNGQQTRVLNVSLYAFLPNPPGATFSALLAHVIQTYQQANPQVLLNVQMNPDWPNIYSFTDLPNLLAQDGFDVMEIDTIYLGALVAADAINPAAIPEHDDQPFAVAQRAATIGNQLWAIPSWLCMDFIYSRSEAVHNVTNLQRLQDFVQTMPQGAPALAGIHNGSWRLPAIYINAYIQNFGYSSQRIAEAMNEDTNGNVVNNMVAVTGACAVNNVNNCTNDSFKASATPGVTEQLFANGQSGTNMGFSEQSFYVNWYRGGQQQQQQLYVAPVVWGNQPQPLLFSDAFVTSRANCVPHSACAADAAAFTSLMTGRAMKTYIVQSQDLQNAPWRTLLVATQPFWSQQAILNDPLYQQYRLVLDTAEPFPNNFTAQIQTRMRIDVCNALKARAPYTCKTS